MKTIQLSERELSIIFSMLTPPYAVSNTHTDEFNELRNKVFYALRDAQNDEPVSNRDELPDIVGWIRSDYHSDRRMGDAPIFILGCIDPSDVWGVKYIPLSGNSPVIPDGWKLVPIVPTEKMVIEGFESEPDEFFSKSEVWEAYQKMSGCEQAAHRAKLCWAAMISAAPQQEVKL
ncbi:hypothetical protein PO583_01240 [Escherichia coli]